MNNVKQAARAAQFLQLHHQAEILILPNVWDALGARLVVGLGYPAVATASAAIAYSLGYDDGEQISFDAMMSAVQRIASVIETPLSVDLERGYADHPDALAENVHRVIHAGVVGINLEDSFVEGGALRDIEEQCRRIQVVRQSAVQDGIPLVINARTDVFLSQGLEDRKRLQEAIDRALAYRQAGADCIYPIGLTDLRTLRSLQDKTAAPLNVLATAETPDVATLQRNGIARLSLGPGLLRAAFSAMRSVVESLRDDGHYETFTNSAPSNDIRTLLKQERMP